MSIIKKIRTIIVVVLLNAAVIPHALFAVPLTSPNYKLDPQGINAVGGQGSSANYRMVSSGGEAVVGNGSGGSYKLSSGYVGALQQSIQLNLTESGVQAYYPLDTNTGIQAYDATANNLNGVISNGSWSSGKIGESVALSGSGAYFEPNYPSSITNEFTYSGWFYVNDFATGSGWGSAFGDWQYNGAGGASGINFIPRNGSIRICAGDSTGSYVNATHCNISFNSSAVTTGAWIFGALTYDGSDLKVYINGTQIGSTARNLTHVSGKFSVGRWSVGYNNYYFNGSVDEIKLFNRALSGSEIQSMYDANNAGITGAVTIPQVTPGVPQNIGLDMTVLTDAGGYNATISQNNNLTHSDSSTTIAATNAGSLTTPGLWDDGTTKGLGFTLTGGLGLDTGKWGTGPVNYKYAALPNTATTFFSRTGLSGGVKEVTNLQFKLDVPTNQKSGGYTNIATVTAVMKP